MLKNKMFNNNSLRSSDILFIKFIYYFYKICGLMVITVNLKFSEVEQFRNLKFVYSTKGVLYNFFLIFCLAILNFFSVKHFSNFKFLDNFETFFQKTQTIFTFIIFFVILTMYSFQQKKSMEIAERLQIITISLTNINRVRDHGKISLLTVVKSIYLINSVIWLILIVTSLAGSEPNVYLFINLSNLTINWMVLQYATIIVLIYHLFENLNYKFVNTFVNSTCGVKSLSSGDEIKSLNLRECLFFHLRRLYLSLCILTKDISDFYSFPMLLCIIYIFMTSLLYLYYDGEFALYNVTFGITFLAYINCFLWVVLYIFALVVISKTASKAVSEVRYLITFFIFL